MPAELLVEEIDGVLHIVFDRPAKHNALTWQMYEQLLDAFERADSPRVRAVVLRSTSPRAFVAGTDITQFREFRGGADGVAYERRVSEVIHALLGVRAPTVAAVGGYCVGGGLLLASACDLRIATEDARFGAPVANTLGNCYSQDSLRLIVALLGRSTTLDLMLRARLMGADEALAKGFVVAVTSPADLATVTAAEVDRLRNLAPLSLLATKASLNRLIVSPDQHNDDLLDLVYGSQDFREAVTRFGSGEAASWSGR